MEKEQEQDTKSCNYFEINLRPGWKGGIAKYARFAVYPVFRELLNWNELSGNIIS